MSTKYYSKEIPEQAVYIFGQPFRFDFLATEDVALITELDKCVRKQVGGVISITKEQYEDEVKKKSIATQSSNSFRRPELQASHLQIPQDRRAVEVVANPGGKRNGMFARQQMDRDGISPSHRQNSEPMPDPIQIPSPSQFTAPPTAKLSEMK